MMTTQSILDAIRPYALSTLGRSARIASKGAHFGLSVLGGPFSLGYNFGPTAYDYANRGINAMTAAGANPVNVGSAMLGVPAPMPAQPNASKFDQAFAAVAPNASDNASMLGPMQAYIAKMRAAGGLNMNAAPAAAAPAVAAAAPTGGSPIGPPLSLAPPSPGPSAPAAPTASPDARYLDGADNYFGGPSYMGTGSTRGDFLGSLFGTNATNGANNRSLVQQILRMFNPTVGGQ